MRWPALNPLPSPPPSPSLARFDSIYLFKIVPHSPMLTRECLRCNCGSARPFCFLRVAPVLAGFTEQAGRALLQGALAPALCERAGARRGWHRRVRALPRVHGGGAVPPPFPLARSPFRIPVNGSIAAAVRGAVQLVHAAVCHGTHCRDLERAACTTPRRARWTQPRLRAAPRGVRTCACRSAARSSTRTSTCFRARRTRSACTPASRAVSLVPPPPQVYTHRRCPVRVA